nr:hypothetical protein [Flavobacterium sp.]
MQRLYSIIPHFADSIRTISNIKVFYTCLFILITFNLKAQIPSFTLNTTVTDETCVGNGTITFGVVGVDPSATISYVVYKLPDLTTPVSITNPTVGLQSGTYRVIATQTLGSLTNTQTVDVVIANNIVPLDYTITSVANGCGNSNNISIVVNAGVATLYEIFWGPVTIPPQASPVFTNVPAGVYQIRVFNDCGAGSVKTFTLLSGAPQINVASGVAAAQLPSCQTVTVTNALTPSSTSVLNYPLTLTYTIFPPDGSTPITLNQTIASGPATQYTASAVMPSYNGQTFTYTLSLTDNCGGTFSQNDNSIQATLRATLASVPAECGTYYLRVRLSYFLGPFTVTFTQSPAGFSPSAFNSSHPNFTNSPVSYGSATNPVPFGDYTVLVTDACGNSATASVLLEDIPAFPSVAFFPFPGCESYKSRVEILIPGYQIATATLTVAPSSYPNALPENLSAFINAQGKLIIPELVTGVYTVVLTDTCGNTYPPFDFTVPPLATSISASTRTDCEANDIGSIRLIGNNTLLTSVVITSAPAAFSAGTLPFDVSSNIAANGAFYMGNLPVGSYAFLVTDNCGVQNTVTRTIADYSVTESSYAIIPQCGTFALTLNHTSNAGAPQFWLQRFYPSLGLWGHPETGVPYVDGIVPDTTTSRQIQANATTLNITQTGQFRIVKSFEGFQSGTPDPKFCWEVLHEFNFDGEFQIIDILKVTCSGLLSDVQIITNGVAPLIFRIVEKNGAPFLIDNGD